MENQVKLFFLSLLQQLGTKRMKASDNNQELSVTVCTVYLKLSIVCVSFLCYVMVV